MVLYLRHLIEIDEFAGTVWTMSTAAVHRRRRHRRKKKHCRNSNFFIEDILNSLEKKATLVISYLET